MHLFQIVMPADKGDLLESALFHPLELMREERLPKERPERLLLQRSKTAGTAGEEEENMHGGHSNRFLRASPAHARAGGEPKPPQKKFHLPPPPLAFHRQ